MLGSGGAGGGPMVKWWSAMAIDSTSLAPAICLLSSAANPSQLTNPFPRKRTKTNKNKTKSLNRHMDSPVSCSCRH